MTLAHDLEDSCGAALCSQELRSRTPRALRDVADGPEELKARVMKAADQVVGILAGEL